MHKDVFDAIGVPGDQVAGPALEDDESAVCRNGRVSGLAISRLTQGIDAHASCGAG